LRDCSVKASRSPRGVSAGSRLHDGTATLHEPFIRAFVDPPDGFHEKPETR
ncbi:unnamed protein product, partial [Ascophyllum nodosum]